jgi:hypothetical protein
MVSRVDPDPERVEELLPLRLCGPKDRLHARLFDEPPAELELPIRSAKTRTISSNEGRAAGSRSQQRSIRRRNIGGVFAGMLGLSPSLVIISMNFCF